MGVVSGIAARQDIGIRQDVKLRFRAPSGSIHWEENGPGDDAAHEADHSYNLEEAE